MQFFQVRLDSKRGRKLSIHLAMTGVSGKEFVEGIIDELPDVLTPRQLKNKPARRAE